MKQLQNLIKMLIWKRIMKIKTKKVKCVLIPEISVHQTSTIYPIILRSKLITQINAILNVTSNL